MAMIAFSLKADYWENFELLDEDIEFIYNNLIEAETPKTSRELVAALITERIRREKQAIEQLRTSRGDLYQPKGSYIVGQELVFPAYQWKSGRVTGIRPGRNPEVGNFPVIQVVLEDGQTHDLASGVQNHVLNEPPKIADDDASLDCQAVLEDFGDYLIETLDEGLDEKPEFVRIAGNWFPRALLVDINVGYLNLAEAVLDMSGGGPLPTSGLLEQIQLAPDVNVKLLEFSMDLALQEDGRFDEVGPAGKTLWFLRRLEPAQVLEPPIYLRYAGLEYDRSVLTHGMLMLEKELDDELSPIPVKASSADEVDVRIHFPHWRSGTCPLSARIQHLFPTAYEAPRIRFTLVDGDTGYSFPAWVVREKRYVFGLKEWYASHGIIPGSIIKVRRGKKPGEVILKADNRRPSREWVRTVLVGSDGGIVFAMLKQLVSGAFDDRMTIAVPDPSALDQAWTRMQKEQTPFDKLIVNMVRELAKLNPQSHVHASELYAAINIIRRCPPGPMLASLATQPWFVHVGDMHYRLQDVDKL